MMVSSQLQDSTTKDGLTVAVNPSRYYFSAQPEAERRWRRTCWAMTAAMAVLLYFFWDPLGSQDFIESLVFYQTERPAVEYMFRAFTFLGDNEFYMGSLPLVIWCIDKRLGFWTAAVLLLSGAWTNVLKELFALPRPAVEGVELPAGYAFPSGHTLTAVAYWGCLAAMLRSKYFWAWTALAIGMVGFSRMILGYHFARDILGGLVFGFLLMVAVFWLAGMLAKVETGEPREAVFLSWPLPLLLALSIGVPSLSVFFLAGEDIPMVMGFLAGAASGYILEERTVRHRPQGSWKRQILKALLGLGVLFAIVAGLSDVLPSHVLPFRFLRYALGGFWVTLVAPWCFVKLGLSGSATAKDLRAAERSTENVAEN